MGKKDTWVLVNTQFLRRVRQKLVELYRKLRQSYKEPPKKALRIMRMFRDTHPMDGGISRFFSEYFRTNLISRRKNDTTKALMFGFLRTLFVGILREAPRTNVFAKRVKNYRETYELAKVLEEFLTLYRKRVGFTKISEDTLPRRVLMEAGIISECRGLSESECQPPMCKYIRTMRRGKTVEYCTRHEKRRRRRTLKRPTATRKHNRTHRKSDPTDV